MFWHRNKIKKALRTLNRTPLNEWPTVWSELNRYNVYRFGYISDKVAWTLMKTIANKVGVYACLREWNKQMTDDEFNMFWNQRPVSDNRFFYNNRAMYF